MVFYFIKYLEQIFMICLLSIGISILGLVIHLFSYQFTTTIPKNMEFDYIIVGAGSAGSTILSGLPQESKTLVLEAGTYKPNFFFDIPAISPALQRSLFDWSYSTEKQTSSCGAMKDNSCKWPSGKGFGGSNILNNMIYYRNHPEDFRGWFSDPENYDYEKDILPYFIESEKLLPIEELKFQSKFGRIFLDNDWNETIEFLKPNVIQKKGMRWSMAHHYMYKLDQNLSNNKIVLNGFVTKIIIDEAENNFEKNSKIKSACGVEFEINNIKYTTFARKGIILSAGTIGTPKILLHSGIGPCNDLNSISIKCIEDLPVGKNLQDHITTGLDLITLNSTAGLSISGLVSPESLLQFIESGHGPMTTVGCDVLGFMKNSLNLPPSLGFMIIPLGITTDYGISLAHNFNIADHVWNEYFYDLIHENTVSILPILLHPKSKGYVKLWSNDTKLKPLINPKYLTQQDDIELLYEGLMLVKSLLDNSKLQALGAKIHNKHFPGCENLEFDSYEYWKCYIRQLTLSVYHPIGTCKIGPSNDDETVVLQTNFQVKNIKNLYVVDASLMPNLPSGNPNSVVMMIANKFLRTLLDNTDNLETKNMYSDL